MDYMDPDALCPKKADKLNRPLTHVLLPGTVFTTWINFNPNMDKLLHPLHSVYPSQTSVVQLLKFGNG